MREKSVAVQVLLMHFCLCKLFKQIFHFQNLLELELENWFVSRIILLPTYSYATHKFLGSFVRFGERDDFF